MILSVGISRVRRDDVANPTECSASSNPETGREDQPKNSRQNPAIVKLSDAWYEETQYACQNRITHFSKCLLKTERPYEEGLEFVRNVR